MADKLNGLFSGVTGDALRGVVSTGRECLGAIVEMMRTPLYGNGPAVALTAEVQDAPTEGATMRKRDLPTMFGCPRGF